MPQPLWMAGLQLAETPFAEPPRGAAVLRFPLRDRLLCPGLLWPLRAPPGPSPPQVFQQRRHKGADEGGGEGGSVGSPGARQRPPHCGCVRVEQLMALAKPEGLQLALKSRQGWGAQQAECPPRALLWEHVASSDALSTGPTPRSPEGGICIITWPCSWAPALDGQTDRRGVRSQGGRRGARGTRPWSRETSAQGLSARASRGGRRTGTSGAWG